MGTQHGIPQQLIEAAIRVNTRQRTIVIGKLADALGGLAGRTVAVLGLAFKPNTSDVREAPALGLCRDLLQEGANVRAFDPIATEEAARALGDAAGSIVFEPDVYTAASGADAVVIMTEWNEFRGLDLEKLRGVVRTPIVLDCRNVLEPARAVATGFVYRSIGRDATVKASAGPASTLAVR